jgi:hypothetical protein
MGRIEDNDAERIERRRQEAEQAAKKADVKRIDVQRQFGAIVAKSQESRGQQQHQDQARSDQQNSANQMLLARRGIASNKISGQNIDDRAMGNDAKRADSESRAMQSAHGRANLQRKAEGKTATSQDMAVSGRSGGGSKQDRSQTKEERKEGASKEAAVKEASFAALGQAIAAMDGVGAKASSGTAGAPSQLSTKEVIDELVARVQQGIEAKAGRNDIDTIRIELKDNVLAGATLTFQHEVGSGKITLKVETGDEEVERLLSASATAQELSRTLQHSKLILSELDVNDNKVIRS